MFRTITCVHCGTRQKSIIRIAPGKKVRCRACGHLLPGAAVEDLLRMQGLMRMGDDDGGGGGDWGGGSSEAEAEGGDDDEDEEEEDGKGGKKKKKAKAKSGGFFANLLGGFIARIITAAIGFGLLGACCCCAVGYGMLFGFPPGFVGEWETQIAKAAEKDKNKAAADKDKKDNDEKDKGKKDNNQEEPDEPDMATLKLVITGDAKTGAGKYTNEDGKELSFKWRDLEKEKSTVVFEMDNKDDKFWKDIKSPATFTFTLANGNNTLTLASGSASMNFERVKKDQPPPAKNVGGGKKKKK